VKLDLDPIGSAAEVESLAAAILKSGVRLIHIRMGHTALDKWAPSNGTGGGGGGGGDGTWTVVRGSSSSPGVSTVKIDDDPDTVPVPLSFDLDRPSAVTLEFR